MLLQLFETRARKAADDHELRRLVAKYEADVVPVLQERLRQPGLSARDKKHWLRLLRKARRVPTSNSDTPASTAT